jgi:large subunit ribosomal protein L4
MLAAFGVESALIVDQKNDNLMRSTRNLQKAKFLPDNGVNVYDILRYSHLFVTKSAVAELAKRLSGEGEKK